jgi:hypothetical protein
MYNYVKQNFQYLDGYLSRFFLQKSKNDDKIVMPTYICIM